MKHTRTNKQPVARSAPDLPLDLAVLERGVEHFDDREIEVFERSIQELKLDGLSRSSLSLEGCILDRVNLSGARFGSVKLKDVRFVRCDLANLDARALAAVRVEFVNCRMTGFRVPEAEFKDVLVSEGDQRYAQFASSTFKYAEFDSCNFEEADFQGADLQGSIFRMCNLHNAEMAGAKLMDADLRGSTVDGLKLNAGDLYGAIVDPTQAMIFAALLGILIK
jgi:uncharacterized protein YjbI with pentapeptide repeats